MRIEKDNDTFPTEWYHRFRDIQFQNEQNLPVPTAHILSFDPKDAADNGLTGERAQLGIEYASKNFPGHQALVCTHTDGNNESGNIHVHIVINSLRQKYDVGTSWLYGAFLRFPCRI